MSNEFSKGVVPKMDILIEGHRQPCEGGVVGAEGRAEYLVQHESLVCGSPMRFYEKVVTGCSFPLSFLYSLPFVLVSNPVFALHTIKNHVTWLRDKHRGYPEAIK